MARNVRRDPSRHFELREARRAGDVDKLLDGLRDPVEAPFAAQFLADVGASRAVPELTGALKSTNPHARLKAATALSRLGAVESVQALVEAAERESVPWARAWILGALADLGDSDRIRMLLIAAVKDNDRRVQGAALRAIARIGRSEDIERMTELREGLGWRRRRAVDNAVRLIAERLQGSHPGSTTR